MLTLIKSYWSYPQRLEEDDDASNENVDVEHGPQNRQPTPPTPTRKPFGAGGLQVRPIECDPDCALYADFFEQFEVAPSRDGRTLLVYHKSLQSEVDGTAIYDDFATRCDEPDGPARVADIVRIYEHLFAEGGSHPRIVRYLGPTVSGYRLERLNSGPMPDRSRLPSAAENDVVLALYQRWALQILSTLTFVHSKGVVVNCVTEEAFWLRPDFSLALACFVSAGSIDTGIRSGAWGCPTLESPWVSQGGNAFPPYTSEEVGHPKGDLFDWAVLVYRWMTGHASPVYEGNLSYISEELRAREAAVAQGQYTDWPEIEAMYLGPVLLKAWKGEYETAASALEDARNQLLQSARTFPLEHEDEIAGVDWQAETEITTDSNGWRSLRLRETEKQ